MQPTFTTEKLNHEVLLLIYYLINEFAALKNQLR